MTVSSNVALLIDYDNTYITLDKRYEDSEHTSLKQDIILKIKDKYKSDKVIFSKMFLDFQKIKLSDEIFDLFKNNQFQLNHVYSGVNASDIALIIDVMKNLFESRIIDKYIIVSSDSDMLPLINEILYRGKHVELFYFECNTKKTYLEFLENMGITIHSIEELLNLPVYKADFSNISLDKLHEILLFINVCISMNYNKYTKKNKGYGTLSKKNLYDCLIESRPIPREYAEKDKLTNYLFEKQMLIEHKYQFNNETFATVLLNETYLESNGVVVENMITKDFYNRFN